MSNDSFQLPHPAEVWYGGKRYDSAEQALLAVLADAPDDKATVLLEVLRDKFARHPDLTGELIEADASALAQTDHCRSLWQAWLPMQAPWAVHGCVAPTSPQPVPPLSVSRASTHTITIGVTRRDDRR